MKQHVSGLQSTVTSSFLSVIRTQIDYISFGMTFFYLLACFLSLHFWPPHLLPTLSFLSYSWPHKTCISHLCRPSVVLCLPLDLFTLEAIFLVGCSIVGLVNVRDSRPNPILILRLVQNNTYGFSSVSNPLVTFPLFVA